MKPLGKAMKIGAHQKRGEKATLNNFLQNYRDTPHTATGIAPGAMIFRDGYRSNFPEQRLDEEEIIKALEIDIKTKDKRKSDYNASIRTSPANFREGDHVLVRNYRTMNKLDPYFLPERYIIMDIRGKGRIILVKSTRHEGTLIRHPNDL